MIKTTLMGAGLLLVSAAPALAGEWTTNYGRMYLPDTPHAGPVRAEYTDDEGRVIGQIRVPKCMGCGVSLSGIWVERGSAHQCDSAKDGSQYWGNVEFTFDPDYTSFTGTWDYCGSGGTRAWRGAIGITRMSQQESK